MDALDARAAQSVEGMLVADVPLGAFVSGGVDSSLIAAMMTDLTRAPIDTFNIGFEGGVAVSEHREAARVAAHIGSRHHALMLSPDHVLDAFDRWIDVFDEPFADQAALPTMLLVRVRAPRRHRGADRRGRRRSLRRLLELPQARARGAPDALARARRHRRCPRW